MTQLGSSFEVVVPLGFLGLPMHAFDRGAKLLHVPQDLPLRLPLPAHRRRLGLQVGKLPPQLLQPLLAGGVLLLAERRFLDLEPGHPPGELVELGGHGVDLGAQHGACLVDEVDRLVGKESVSDVSMAENGRSDERRVLDLHAMEHLEALAQTAEDRDGVLHGWLVDQHGLEAPLERGVLFDVLSVLGKCGGPDHVELATGQHRLEHVPGVHRPFGRTGTDDRVELVDE